MKLFLIFLLVVLALLNVTIGQLKALAVFSLLILVLIIFFIVYAAKKYKETKKSLVTIISLISQKAANAIDQVMLFVDDAEQYFIKHEDGLFNDRFIESKDALTLEVVLVDALLKQDLLVYVDWKQEPDDVLEQLLKLSEGKLKESNLFKELEHHYAETENCIGEFFDEKGDWPSIFSCARDVGLNLMAINEDSDSYPLFFIKSSQKEIMVRAFKDADLKLYNFSADEI